MLCVLLFGLAWHLRPLDTACAQTTIRLWHELHVARNVAHDFTGLLSPSSSASTAYYGALKHDEIRAIALCNATPPSVVCIRGVAHAPNQPDAGQALLALLVDECDDCGVDIDWPSMRGQPRWFCELLWLSATTARSGDDATK